MFKTYWSVCSLLWLICSSWVGHVLEKRSICFLPAVKAAQTLNLCVYSREPKVIFHQCFCPRIRCLCHTALTFLQTCHQWQLGFKRRTCGVLWSCGISPMYPVKVSKIVVFFTCNGFVVISRQRRVSLFDTFGD